jgi:hypothetical protein
LASQDMLAVKAQKRDAMAIIRMTQDPFMAWS